MNDDASNARVHIEELLAHSSWVRGLAATLVADAATADDLVQETWLAALRHPPRGGQPVRPWLGRVVRNFAKQWRRGERRRDSREVDATDVARAVPSPDALVARIETQRLLAGLVVALDEPYRTTVILRYDDGVTAAEIAKRQKIPAGTVRWRLKVGLDALRAKLDERHGGDRRAWCALLLPLALREPVKTSVVAALGNGVLAMNAFGKVLVGMFALVALVLGLFLAGVVPRTLWRFHASETPAVVTFRPMRPEANAKAMPPTAPIPPAPRDDARASAPAPAKAPDAAPNAARFEVRFLDEANVPLRGACLLAGATSSRVSPTSGADGRVAFDFVVSGESSDASFVATCPGRASRQLETQLRAGETTWLGDIVLGPGGAVSGRVVDESGAGLAGICVRLGVVDQLKDDLEGERRRGHYGSCDGIVTRTASDGSFVLDGAPVGFTRLWASAEEFLSAYSPPIEVRASQESQGVTLVLEKLSANDVIEGIVIGGDGTPVAHAHLEYRYQALFGRGGSGSFNAGGDGRFRLRLATAAPYDLTASDPVGRWSNVHVERVEPGTRDLVLRLPEARFVDLSVSAKDGTPVEAFSIGTYVPEHDDVLRFEETARRDGGHARVAIPAQPFVVEIGADLFELATLGPFDPNAVPDRLACTLEPVPGVRGRVLAARVPVSGAKVTLYEVADEQIVHNGFRVLVRPDAEVEGRSDSDGRFALTVRKDGRFVVRAESPGLAPADVGPLEIQARVGAKDVEITIGPGGAIEGRVKVAAPRSAEGTIVGISRGDAHAVTQRVGPDGRYRFERLTPGRWLISACETEIVANQSFSTMSGRASASEIPSNCAVAAGQTTHFDLELGGPAVPRTRVVGSLTIDGRPAATWSASLHPSNREIDDIRGPASVLDGTGSFTLEPSAAGAVRLVLACPAEDSSGMRILDVVDPAGGEATWRLDLRTGRLDGEGLKGAAATFPALVHVWTRGETLFCFTPIQPDASGRFALAAVPAGRGRIAGFDPATATYDPREWPTLAEVDVPAGGAATVTLR